jgi:hypothetical protein
MRIRHLRLTLGLLLLVAACDKSPTPPTQPTVPHPPVTNTPPVIQSVTSSVTTRTEVDTDVQVTAQVQDAETPPADLTYLWTANAGQFSGNGPSVTWRLPKGSVATPVDVTIHLQVVERYQDYDPSGAPIYRQNTVSADAAPFRVHDSVAEISAMSLHFLIDLFGNYNVSPDACMVDFWDGCSGKDEELSEIEVNRMDFRISGADATVQSVTLNADRTFATVDAPCEFHDVNVATDSPDNPKGDCVLTAVYQDDRWWLCSSDFNPDDSSSAPAAWRRRR